MGRSSKGGGGTMTIDSQRYSVILLALMAHISGTKSIATLTPPHPAGPASPPQMGLRRK